jgi:methylmalonyl-CoA mutase C-terminal domain/subunit
MSRKIRVLVAKPGLDGHDRGAKVVAAALRDAGMEVIYTGLHQSPEQIVEAAVDEDADVVALSILSGAHMTLFPEVLRLMRQRGIGDRLLTGGGIVPPGDAEALARLGVGRLFGPGSSTREIADYIEQWFAAARGRDGAAAGRAASAPAGPPRSARPARRGARGRRATSASGRTARPAASASRRRQRPGSGRSPARRPVARRPAAKRGSARRRG